MEGMEHLLYKYTEILASYTSTYCTVYCMYCRVNRKIEGTGLGLHILKRAVERLEGKVAVESELGKGTTFKVTLPK